MLNQYSHVIAKTGPDGMAQRAVCGGMNISIYVFFKIKIELPGEDLIMVVINGKQSREEMY